MNTSALVIGSLVALYVVVRFRKTGIEKKKWSGGTGVISWYWVSLSFSIDWLKSERNFVPGTNNLFANSLACHSSHSYVSSGIPSMKSIESASMKVSERILADDVRVFEKDSPVIITLTKEELI